MQELAEFAGKNDVACCQSYKVGKCLKNMHLETWYNVGAGLNLLCSKRTIAQNFAIQSKINILASFLLQVPELVCCIAQL